MAPNPPTPPSRPDQRDSDDARFQQLVALVTQLAQATVIRSVEDSPRVQRSVKIADPPTLSDGVNPTFDSWHLALTAKFEVNSDHFTSEQARKYQVYVCTEGVASEYLYPRYKPDAAEPFGTAQEMMTYLKQFFQNPHRVRDARYEYQSLKMKPTDTFFEFQTIFLRLANKAEIARSEWFDDLYDKLTLHLQGQLAIMRHTLGQDVNKLCELASGADTENRRIGKLRAAQSPKSSTQLLSKTFSQASATTTSPSAPAPKPFSPAPRQATPVLPPVTKPALPESDKITCYTCGNPGHTSVHCPQRVMSPELKDIAGEAADENETDADAQSVKDYA